MIAPHGGADGPPQGALAPKRGAAQTAAPSPRPVGAEPAQRDAVARATAWAAAQPPRLRRRPEPHDAETLLSAERRQAEAWERIERLARGRGDGRTAALAAAIAADDRAMAARLAANRERWARTGPRAGDGQPAASPRGVEEPRT